MDFELSVNLKEPPNYLVYTLNFYVTKGKKIIM